MQSPKSNPGPQPHNPSRQSRLELAGTISVEIRDRIEQFIHLAERGLPRLRSGEGFAHTGRRVSGDATQVRAEGDNLRYALMVALGLGQRDRATQVSVLGGSSATGLATYGAARAADAEDLGAVALGAWALAEVAGRADEMLFERLEVAIASDAAIDTVICAWALTRGGGGTAILRHETACSGRRGAAAGGAVAGGRFSAQASGFCDWPAATACRMLRRSDLSHSGPRQVRGGVRRRRRAGGCERLCG